jgi:hypothetical protein
MDTRQQLLLLIMTRIQCFLDRHSRAVGTVNQSRARAAVDDLVRAGQFNAVAQRVAAVRSRSHTAQRRALREELRTAHLRPIVAVARARGAAARILSCLRLPAKAASDRMLLAAAEHIARIADEQRHVFLEEGFPEDFVERLEAAIDAVSAADADYSRCCLDGVKATFAISELIKRGRGLVRVLDALVVPKLADKPELLAAWKACIAIKNPPSGKRVPMGAPSA